MDEARIHERRWWALAIMCLSLGVISLDNTILNVAIPALERHVHASTSQLQWILDGYTLVFAGLLLTTGSLGDRFGRKGALSVGLAIFGTGSLMSAFAGSASVLIFTRAFMGVGSALIMPSTLSLLTNVFRDPTERGRAIGAWAAVAGASGSIGPLIGGFLLQHFWWGSVFLINVPIVAFVLVAGRFLLPSSRDPSSPRLDPVGALLSVAGLVALLWGIIEAPTSGWSSPVVVASEVLGVSIIGGFVWWELHCDHPMLQVRFFRNRRFTAANIGITMVYFSMFGSNFLITQYLQTVLGYSALQAGFRMLPMAVLMIFTATLSPRLVERIGSKIVVGGGLLCGALGLGIASTVSDSSGYGLVVVAMGLLSIGMGLVLAPATESIMGSVPPERAGIGSAMNDTTRQMGGALGVAVIGSVLATSYRPAVARRLVAMHVSPSIVTAAKNSIGGAVQAASTLPPALDRAVTVAARHEFVRALGASLLVASLVAAVAAVVVFAFLPARAGDVRESVSSARDGIASLTFAEAEGALETDTAETLDRVGHLATESLGSRPGGRSP